MNAITRTGMAVGMLAMFLALTACASGKNIKQGTEEFSVPEAKYHEALMLYDSAMYFESIQAWKEVLEGEPRFAQGQFNLALVYDRLSMIPEAIEHYELAVQFQEDSMVIEQGREWKEDQKQANAELAIYNLHLGAAYLRSNLLDEAEETLNEALRIDQYNPAVHYNLAAVFVAREDYEAALIHADKAVDLASEPGPGTDGLSKNVDRDALGNYLLRQARCHAERAEWQKARECTDRAWVQCKAEPSGKLKKLLQEEADREAAALAEKEKAAREAEEAQARELAKKEEEAYLELSNAVHAMDGNKDGKLSKTEFKNDSLFDRLDSNSDGVLTMKEMAADKDAVLQSAANNK